VVLSTQSSTFRRGRNSDGTKGESAFTDHSEGIAGRCHESDQVM
jgi:hypothetical protein